MKNVKELLRCLAVLAVLMGLILIGYWVGTRNQPIPCECNYTPLTPPKGAGIPSSLRNAPAPTFDDLLDAIEWVESKGDPWALGDDGKAVGSFQIHKIYVDDVNRIMKIGSFEYHARSSKKKSRDMVKIYLKHYGGTFEDMARKHNGGPRGHLKESTKPYWEKVKARLELRLQKASE